MGIRLGFFEYEVFVFMAGGRVGEKEGRNVRKKKGRRLERLGGRGKVDPVG